VVAGCDHALVCNVVCCARSRLEESEAKSFVSTQSEKCSLERSRNTKKFPTFPLNVSGHIHTPQPNFHDHATRFWQGFKSFGGGNEEEQTTKQKRCPLTQTDRSAGESILV